jgi:ABC-type multidrug transport system ATPase subunit
MTISLQNIGKKFRNEWIFRNLSCTFKTGESYTFVGRNGSGKSTLLQIISGIVPANEGSIQYQIKNQAIEPENIYKHLSFAAPYLELVEEFTLAEAIDFHKRFKQLPEKKAFLEIIELESQANKPIKFFSSGMKQRLKLGLAFYSETEILILDEPTSNLDKNGIDWYLKHLEQSSKNKLILIGSNQSHEYEFCKNIIEIETFK